MQQQPAKRIPPSAPDQTTPANAFYDSPTEMRAVLSPASAGTTGTIAHPKNNAAVHIILRKQAVSTGAKCSKQRCFRLLAINPSDRLLQCRADSSCGNIMQLGCDSTAPAVNCPLPESSQGAKAAPALEGAAWAATAV
jgi:hypothetical protein